MQSQPSSSKISYRTFVIDEQKENQRLDNYLISKIKVPRTLIYNLLRRGKIKVNQRKNEPSYRLEQGDVISIPEQFCNSSQKPTISQEQASWILDYIIDETDHYIVVNKPAGLASHGGSGHSFGLIELLRIAKPQLQLELVHRLDRETSGLIVVAKKRSFLRDLNQQFAERSVEKLYLTILSHPLRKVQKIDSPLAISKKGHIRISVPDFKEGQPCQTTFVPLSRYENRSLCLAIPETGRMHQIRAHAASMQNPILGDIVYSGDQNPHFYLHAAQLSFEYQSEVVTYQQEPPEFWDAEFFKGWNLWNTINKHSKK